MSKRPRATRSTKRSRPQSAPSARPAAPRPTIPAETAAAVATLDPAPQAAAVTPRPATARSQARSAQRSAGVLAQKASEEYVYVARDLRRIGTYAAFVVVFLALVWVLVDLLHVIAI